MARLDDELPRRGRGGSGRGGPFGRAGDGDEKGGNTPPGRQGYAMLGDRLGWPPHRAADSVLAAKIWRHRGARSSGEIGNAGGRPPPPLNRRPGPASGLGSRLRPSPTAGLGFPPVWAVGRHESSGPQESIRAGTVCRPGSLVDADGTGRAEPRRHNRRRWRRRGAVLKEANRNGRGRGPLRSVIQRVAEARFRFRCPVTVWGIIAQFILLKKVVHRRRFRGLLY